MFEKELRQLSPDGVDGAGEETTPETTEVEIAGHKTIAVLDDDGVIISVENPTGLEEDELSSWQSDAQNEINMKKSATSKYKDASEANKAADRTLAKAEEILKKAEETKADILALGSTGKVTADGIKEPRLEDFLAEVTGEAVKNKRDIDAIKTDDPEAYIKAQEKYYAARGEYVKKQGIAQLDQQLEAKLLLREVEADPEIESMTDLTAWLKARGRKLDKYSLEDYKNSMRVNSMSLKKTVTKQFAKKTKVSFLPSGSTAVRQKTSPDKATKDNMLGAADVLRKRG